MAAAQNALKAGRVLHLIFLMAAFLYIWVPLSEVQAESREVPLPIVLAIACVALSNVGLAVFFRSRHIRPSAEKLLINPDDASAARQWRRGVILTLVFCLTIVLLGLTLRIVGLTWKIASLFYAVGILLMLAWSPRLDLPAQ